jgi:excisionase family DNA binding protein
VNFADAIRQAALNSGLPSLTEGTEHQNGARHAEAPPAPSWQPGPAEATAKPRLEVIENAPPKPQPKPKAAKRQAEHEFEAAPGPEVAYDAISADPVELPQAPPAPVVAGNVVRLELFLSPEQLNSVFRAVVATQHSVMTLREAAAYLRVSPGTLETMAQEGQIPAFLIDGRWRFARNSVDEWLNMQSLHKEMEA